MVQASTFLSDLLPEGLRRDFAWVRRRESLQLLRALGYLPGLEGKQMEGAESEVAAWGCFRAELAAWADADPEAYARLMEAVPLYLPELRADAPLSADEVELLKQLTGLEGECSFSHWGGEPGLCGRVLQHRLRCLGLGAGTDARAALARVGGWAGCANALETLNLCGDAGALAVRILAVQGPQGQGGVLYARRDGEKGGARALLQAGGERFCGGLQARLDAGQWAEFEEKVLGRAGKKQAQAALEAHLTAATAGDVNGVLLQVLRLRLWIEGFLEAAPQGAFGGEDWAGLEGLLGFRGGIGAEKAGEADALLVHVQGGVWAINAGYFFEELCPGGRGSAESEQETIEGLQSLYTEAPDYGRLGIGASEAEGLRAELEKRLGGYGTGLGAEPAAGLGGYVRSRVSGLFGWLRRQVETLGAALERLLGYVRGGVGGLYAGLQRAFDVLGRGLDALRGLPLVQTAWSEGSVETEFGVGMAPVTRVSGKVNSGAVAAHVRLVGAYVESLRRVWAVAGTLVRWGLSLGRGPTSWVEVGIALVRMVQAAAKG